VHRGLPRIVQGGMDYTPPCLISELPGLKVSSREQQGVEASALEFAILTAARTSEVLAAL
jgi:hypothetical protein